MDFYEKTLFSIERHTGNTISVDEHFHSLYEFYYLKNGTATYLTNDKIYNLAKGDIVVIPPNTLHKTVSSGKRERDRILFYLDRSFIKIAPNAEEILPNEPLFCHTENNIRLRSIFEEMLNEANTTNDSLYLEALICELLVVLSRTAKSESAENEHIKLPKIISDVLAYIASNYSTDLTLKSISEHFYTNSSYLSRLFKQHTGFTFCNYLNNYRIKEANKLLAETNKPITEIALDCGFNSSNNFCKCYKKLTKTSPLAYRKYITKRQNIN